MGPTEETATLLARLPGVHAYDLEVVATSSPTPAVRRVRLHDPGLETLGAKPGQDLMVAVPAGDAHFRRRYSIRRFEPDAAVVEIDVVLHGDGPGARWAAAVRQGDRVEAIGPRGKILVDPEAEWHLFACDEAGLPASLAMAESLAPGRRAIVVAEVSGPEEHQGGTISVQWLDREGPPGTGRALADAVAALSLPPGTGHAYLAGELTQVAAARSTLVERGIPAASISHKAYWRLGVSNAAHGEPARD